MHKGTARLAAAAILLGALVTAPAGAQERKPGDDVAREAVETLERPLRDTNLKPREIPPVLARAARAPYSTSGLGNCRQIAAEVRALDRVLGEDVDVMRAQTDDDSPARIAGRAGVGALGEFIGGIVPVRPLVREVTGAREADIAYRRAVAAGTARRGFLKGLGSARGCKPPAAPARRR